MKKIIAISFLGFIICTAFNMSATFTDYRDSYTGNYLCNATCQGMRNSSNQNPVLTDVVTVSIAKDASDSILQINIGQNKILAKVRNNILQSSGGQFQGKIFASDSIAFIVLRLGNVCSYKGKRQ